MPGENPADPEYKFQGKTHSDSYKIKNGSRRNPTMAFEANPHNSMLRHINDSTICLKIALEKCLAIFQ